MPPAVPGFRIRVALAPGRAFGGVELTSETEQRIASLQSSLVCPAVSPQVNSLYDERGALLLVCPKPVWSVTHLELLSQDWCHVYMTTGCPRGRAEQVLLYLPVKDSIGVVLNAETYRRRLGSSLSYLPSCGNWKTWESRIQSAARWEDIWCKLLTSGQGKGFERSPELWDPGCKVYWIVLLPCRYLPVLTLRCDSAIQI